MADARFALTWDYRCPFARIVHDHVVAALQAGAPWEVEFRAFALDQAHVEPGGTAVWEAPDRYPGITATLAGIVVRDRMPEQFLDVHHGLFAARHEHSHDLRDPVQLAKALTDCGIDSDRVLEEIRSGWPVEQLREEHTSLVERYQVFGVPTFIVDDRAVFVRLMRGPDGDADRSRATIERVLAQITGWPELNEFKHTSISN